MGFDKKITKVEIDAREAPLVIGKQIQENTSIIKEITERLHREKLIFAMTVGRGSSGSASNFGKYLLETRCGLPTVSAAPSIITIYKSKLSFKNSVVICVSQSGASPDICAVIEAARRSGAITIAIVNQPASTLSEIAEFTIPMLAGDEQAITATKTYLSSLTNLLQLVAYWKNDKGLLDALSLLPDKLTESLNMDWAVAASAYEKIDHTLILARGYGLPIAREAAIKLQETSAIQAKAFSGAEFLHGPLALVRSGHPYLIFTQNDASLNGMIKITEKIKNLGGKNIISASQDIIEKTSIKNYASIILPLPVSFHPMCDPIMGMQAFYIMMAKIAVIRGYDPDYPKNVQKIIKTL